MPTNLSSRKHIQARGFMRSRSGCCRTVLAVVLGLLASDTYAFLVPTPWHHILIRQSRRPAGAHCSLRALGLAKGRPGAGKMGISMQSETASDSFKSSQRQLPKVIGHRGAKAVAPENTIASIRAAKALGCCWVEVDVMLSKDKVPVIHHDNTLSRCTNGQGNLWDYTLKELEQLDAGSHYDEASGFPATRYPGEQIPQLTTLLQCCRDLDLGLNLEVKHVTQHAPEVPSPREQEMEEELANVVCDTIEDFGVQPSQLVFSSFSRPAIAVLRRRLPHFSCAFLVEDIPDDWEEFMAAHGCASLNFGWPHPANTPAKIEECASKVPCYVYTINDGEVARQLLSLGVSGVFSDCPHLVQQALARSGLDTSITPRGSDETVAARGKNVNAQRVTIREAPWTWDSLGVELPDAQILSDLRRVVFIEEQNVSEEDEWEGGEEECWHWLAVVDGQSVGTVRVKPDGTIGRMAVLKEFRSRGVGAALLQRAVCKVESLGLDAAQLSAQTHAISFYERFGFLVQGAEFEDAGIPHVRMSLNFRDRGG